MTTQTPNGISKPVVHTIQEIHCPTCESRVGGGNLANAYDDHPKLHTMRRTVTIDCEHCGDRHVAVLSLQGGVWVHETVRRVPRKRSA